MLEKLIFEVGSVNYSSPDYGTFLFNRNTHLLLQDENNWLRYTAKRSDVCAIIHFHLKDGIAISPLKAPFGSFELLKRITEQEIDRWLTFILSDLKARGCKSVKIKNYPFFYAPEATRLIKKSLTLHRFECSEETSSSVQVTNESFEGKISVAKRQKLKKCLTHFSFFKYELNHLDRIYSFISDTRQIKGYQLSMNWKEMQYTAQQLPNHFLLFAVEEAGQLVAAAICIRVSDSILYTFYYAHAAKYDKVSPVTMLLQGIYQFAANLNIKLIDLGTSQADGKLNPSLLHFKKSVGGKPSAKYSFTKSLE